VRVAPRTHENPTVDSHRPIWDAPTVEITASRFKFRANAPEDRKAISYQAESDFLSGLRIDRGDLSEVS